MPVEPRSARTRAALVSVFGTYAGSSLAIVKGIVFVPLYLKLLGTDVYGVWLASGNVVGMLGLLDAGISHALYQRLAESWGAGDRARFSRTATAASVLLGGLMAILVTTGAVLAPFVPKILHAPPTSWTALSIAFFLATCGAAGSILLNNLIAISAAWQHSELGASARISGQLAEIIAIGIGLWLGWGVLALGVGAVVGSTTGLLLAGVRTSVRWAILKLEVRPVVLGDVEEIIHATLPLMLGRIILQIDGNIEVALVSILMNPTAAAIYGITDRVLRLAMSFINPIAGSAVSGLSHLVGEKGRSEAIRPARELIAVWSLVVAATLPVLLVLNRDFTALWVGSSNYGGLALNAALFSSELLGGREWLFSVLLLSSGAIATSAWISTVECLLRMPLMFLALRTFGWVGLPLAQAAVSVGFLFVYAGFVGKEYTIDARRRLGLLLQGLGPLLVSILLALVETFSLPAATTWATLILKGCTVGSAHLALAVLLSPIGRKVFARRLSSALPSVFGSIR